MAENNAPDRKNRSRQPNSNNPANNFEPDESSSDYLSDPTVAEGNYYDSNDEYTSPSSNYRGNAPSQPTYPFQPDQRPSSGREQLNQPPLYGTAPSQRPYRQPYQAGQEPYAQPNQFSPEGIPPANPQYQDWSPSAGPESYSPASLPTNVPPHRRPAGYRPYQPVPGTNLPPNIRTNYRQPPPPVEDNYGLPVPPVYGASTRNRVSWGEPTSLPPSRYPSWLIPLLVALIVVLLISGIILGILLSNKNSASKSSPTVVAVNNAATATKGIVTSTPALTTASSTATVVATDFASAAVVSPTATNGTPQPSTSTPGASAITQLAQFNATLTAAQVSAPALPATPALTSQLSPTGGTPGTPDVSSTLSPAAGSLDQLYQTGVQAMSLGQWQTAITAFEQIQATQPQYKDTPALLAQAYTEQGKASVNDANTVPDLTAARQFFEKALALKPGDVTIKRLEQELDLYANGRVQYESGQWQQAINYFAPLYKLEPNYKDNIQLLYTAYLNQGDLLAGQTKLNEALAAYKSALALPVNDNSLAQQKITQLQLQFTPTATPLPPQTPTPLATATPVPTATPALVNGCPLGSYNFGPFEVQSNGPSSNPDQGKGTLQGLVVNVNNQPIAGAVIQVVSSGGRYSYTVTTGEDGRYTFASELGRDTWTVKLLSAPNIQICYAVPVKVFVNGLTSAAAIVNLVQTRP